jgi:uncharacterized repeat protein (TIGR03837 family)
LLGPTLRRDGLRAVVLPALPQSGYDALLWACDLNFVRGEDSFVRAQWAARPFVWQAYPQHDGVHATKVEAFVERFVADAEPALAASLRALFGGWNGAIRLPALPEKAAWRTHTERWREQLLGQADLISQLLGFVRETG